MEILFYLLIVLLLLWIMVKASDYFVTSSSHIANYFGVSELLIGLTIVALGTSSPEFVVTAIASAKGEGALALSNIVGSNIFVLGFTLGVVGMFSKARTSDVMIYRDCSILLLATFLLYFFTLDGVMSRFEGSVFIALFALWFFLLVKIKDGPKVPIPVHEKSATPKDYSTLIFSLGVILLGGHLLVGSAVQLATLLGVSEWMIGVTIVAIGTSLPEFITSVVAMAKQKLGISVGGLIGSGIFNIIGIVGVSSAIQPIVPGPKAPNSIAMLLITMIIMTAFLASGRHLRRWEAAILFGIAILRILMDILAG